MDRSDGDGSESGQSALLAILVILVLVLAVSTFGGRFSRRHSRKARPPPLGPVGPHLRPPLEPHLRPPLKPREGFEMPCMPLSDAVAGDDSPERRSVHAALSRLYSTADVDPLITGQLYAHADGIRNVYAERTSHGDVHGLTEYSSSGGPGDVGVDVGPFGLVEYGGKEIGFDDGIPKPYNFPSTPLRWYGPRQRDYYGPEGPTVYSEGLYSLTEPDHDPLVG
jgi:hypothetical protein